MATIRRRNGKWQAQVRRKGFPEVSKTFSLKTDALEWARVQERQADKGELGKPRLDLSQIMLSDLVERYLQTVVPIKKSAKTETIVLKAFLRHRICKKPLDKLTTADFAKYRDERLQKVISATVKRQLNPIRHMFEIARHEWDIPLKTNPLDRLSLNYIDRRRERRLKPEERQRLLEGAKQLQNPYISTVIEWALETAMRRGEIASLTWESSGPQTTLSDHPRVQERLFKNLPTDAQSSLLVTRQFARETERGGLCFSYHWQCDSAGLESLSQIIKYKRFALP